MNRQYDYYRKIKYVSQAFQQFIIYKNCFFENYPLVFRINNLVLDQIDQSYFFKVNKFDTRINISICRYFILNLLSKLIHRLSWLQVNK